MLVDWDGRVLVQANPGSGEQVVVGPIDVATLRAERERRRGHDMRSHLRTGVHTYLDEACLPPAGHTEPITTDSIHDRIDESKQASGGTAQCDASP